MGSLITKAADQQHLLDDRDEVTLLDEMSVVLMGRHGVGKNTVGNAILKKKAFRSKDSSKDYYLKHENTTFGRHIIVTRVPGWHADLNSEKNFQHWRVIKDSLWSVKEKPHAIILVVDMNTKPADTTKEKLKQLLGENVLHHILIVSVNSKNIVVYHSGGKTTTIHRCKYHLFSRCTCEEQNIKFIETIEYFIAYKNDLRFYDMQNKAPNLELQLQEQAKLVDGLKHKISVLSSRNNEMSNVITSQNDEIKQLESLLKEKEKMLRAKKEKIARLKSNQNHTELSALHKRIEQLENEAKEKDEEIEKLKKENQELKKQHERKTKASFMSWPKKKATNSIELELLIPAETMDGEAHQDSEVERGVQFVKKNRNELIARIVAVMPIADDLFPFIGQHKYDLIKQAPNGYDKNRELYDIIDKGGTTLQKEFYKSLLKHEKCLVEDLEELPK
ncbi:immune-associated nucleotide-binding protein 11-like [Tachysurus fulvidraco]|uniref:immune-associated nucleotide-binding protein 11-like n=1 Tax=Tachysurus fulvidraco TaxID=1234273 RepID=UPI001FED537C|nr:immune-associated nucleotide-binding protein 11-like [Tachysurus fulvidraco]XP_047657662.1 immune-associated nucleotide-binding protein 11-like [Tachysurus fulvidraco]